MSLVFEKYVLKFQIPMGVLLEAFKLISGTFLRHLTLRKCNQSLLIKVKMCRNYESIFRRRRQAKCKVISELRKWHPEF